jgi:hypothetical protein
MMYDAFKQFAFVIQLGAVAIPKADLSRASLRAVSRQDGFSLKQFYRIDSVAVLFSQYHLYYV